MSYQQKSKGFTLVEMMVVIGIIILILGVLTAAFMDARRNSRDRARVADLNQIEFALNAYRELNRSYPDYPEGANIGLGGALDAELGTFWDSSIEDPLNDNTYHYYYQSEFTCDGQQYVAVLASSMEVERNSNIAELCISDSGFENAYVLLVDGPLSAGGGSGFLTGNNIGNWWEDPENQTWNERLGIDDGGEEDFDWFDWFGD